VDSLFSGALNASGKAAFLEEKDSIAVDQVMDVNPWDDAIFRV
jgi:hypothetical protein